MTMVNSSALAIIVNSSVSVRVFPQTFAASGSGRKVGSNGGPPEARLGYPGVRTSGWDIAWVGRKLSWRGRRVGAGGGGGVGMGLPRPARVGRGSRAAV